MSGDVQQLIIARIVRDGDLVAALDNGITDTFFTQERWLQSWQWIYKYWSEHGEVPLLTAYTRRFPSFKLPETDEPMSALIAELRDERKYFVTMEGLQEAINHFDAQSPDDAITAVARLLSTVNAEVSHSSVSSSSLFISTVIREAIERKRMTLVGIPTGFPTIDEATGGLQAEQLITLIGLPKTFKTSIVVATSIAVQRFGKRVLMVSFEMSEAEIEQRYLSLGAEVDLNKILRGGVTQADENKLYEFEAEVTDGAGEFVIVHDLAAATTVGKVGALIERHQPDVVVVDGAYMLEDEHGEKQGSAQAITNVTRGMKRLAQRARRPIIMTTQALFSRTSRTKGTQADSAGYSSSWQQDSDVYMGIDRPDYSLPQSKLKIIFARNALGVETDLVCDYTLGQIREMTPSYTSFTPKDEDE